MTDFSTLSDDAIKQSVLDKIASGEAHNYTTIYGGHQFSSLDQHPNIPVLIESGPNAGKYSTAAGRYQFLYKTWQEQQRRLGLTDFSPSSQDAAAWDLAQRTYRAQTGRSIVADARSGNVDWSSLGGTWESLKGKGAGPGGGPAAGPSAVMAGGVASPSLGLGAQQPVDPRTAAIQTMLQQVLAKPAPTPVRPVMAYDPSKYTGIAGGLNG